MVKIALKWRFKNTYNQINWLVNLKVVRRLYINIKDDISCICRSCLLNGRKERTLILASKGTIVWWSLWFTKFKTGHFHKMLFSSRKAFLLQKWQHDRERAKRLLNINILRFIVELCAKVSLPLKLSLIGMESFDSVNSASYWQSVIMGYAMLWIQNGSPYMWTNT